MPAFSYWLNGVFGLSTYARPHARVGDLVQTTAGMWIIQRLKMRTLLPSQQ
jgi:hypothetical protein